MKFFELDTLEPAVRADLQAAFDRVLDSRWMILGPELAAFEAEFAACCGAGQCVGVGNGLDALILTLRAAGIGPGQEVIVPAHTFAATWLAVAAVGARPVPVEVDPATYVVTPDAAAAAITGRTAAILPVSLYGHPLDMPALMALAERHGLFVLEDAAQAHGSAWNGRRTGGQAHATAFSFYPTKNLGALGDAGAITTNDPALADRLRKLRNYGSTRRYVHDIAGGNSRLDELQAAFLRVRLKTLDAANDRRRALAARYDAALAGPHDVIRPVEAMAARHVYHLYVVRMPDRDRVQARLAERGIETLIHYPTPCHLQPAFADLGFAPRQFPLAERLAREALSLPMWPALSDGAPAEVAAALSEALQP